MISDSFSSQFGVQENPRAREVREVLRKLARCEALRYGLGEYHVPYDLSRAQKPPAHPEVEAKLHYAAAIAFAPYLSLTEVPALALDRAFDPEFVHEAHYHLKKAFRLIEKATRIPFRERVGTALQRLQRFAEYPGWHVVTELVGSKHAVKEGFELAIELIDEYKLSGTPIHPLNFVTAAQAAEQSWAKLRKDPSFQDQAQLNKLKLRTEELFEEAALACDDPAFATERDLNRLRALSVRAKFLRNCPVINNQPDLAQSADELVNEILHLLEEGKDGTVIPGEWYESEGDRLQSNEQASRFYDLGVHWTPNWHQLWIKLVGCSRESPDTRPCPTVEHMLVTTAKDILHFSRIGLERDQKRITPWVHSRWVAGIEQFQFYFAKESTLKSDLEFYAYKLGITTTGLAGYKGEKRMPARASGS